MDYQCCCPYFERMGVCLEPAACFLKHKTMNINAKEFVPNFAAGPKPQNDPTQIQSTDLGDQASANIEKALKEAQASSLGMIGTMDGPEGMQRMLYTVESRLKCKCCHGIVNNCQGQICKELGICYCMVVDEEDIEWE